MFEEEHPTEKLLTNSVAEDAVGARHEIDIVHYYKFG